MTQPTVLISGAGIAGPALALLADQERLSRDVVELADGIRPGGQTVDLRGAGGDVVERMGLIDQMRALALDQRGVAWIEADGSRRAEMPVTAFDGNGLVSKLEILRGDLVDVLYQATKDTASIASTPGSELTRTTTGSTSPSPTARSCPRIWSSAPTDRIRRCAAWSSGPRSSSSSPLGGYNAWFTAPDTSGSTAGI